MPVMTPTMADMIEIALFDDDAGISEALLPTPSSPPLMPRTYPRSHRVSAASLARILSARHSILGKKSWTRPSSAPTGPIYMAGLMMPAMRHKHASLGHPDMHAHMFPRIL